MLVLLKLLMTTWLASVSVQAQDGMKAFEQTAFPFLVRNCGECHGVRQAPLFAVADLTKAYPVARRFANFQMPASSKLVERSQNGHCGLTNCMTDGREMTRLITEWAKGEVDLPQNRIRTQEVVIPDLQPGPFVKLTFDLAQLQPVQTGLQGSKLELEIAAYTVDSILIRRPRIRAANNVAIYVRDLEIELNAQRLTNQRFKSVDQTIGAAVDAAVLSSEKLLIGTPVSGSKLRLSFAAIKGTTALVNCKKPEMFQAQVLPIMELRNCFYCHGGGPQQSTGIQAAVSMWDMRKPALELCKGAVQRANFAQPLRSPLIWFAVGNEDTHPKSIPFVDEVVPDWTSWIEAEK
ncbi:MAG: hypothetical protein AB7F59_12980 [Bdellovibrionales bacterium]